MCQWTTYTKFTHNWHIFHWFLCQFTVYTQHWHMTYTFFPRFLVSMGSLHKNWHISYTFSFHCRVNLQLTQKLTHYWHIFYWILCQFTDDTQNWHMTDTFFSGFLVSMRTLHKNWLISYTFLGFFTPGFHISRVSKCVKMCQIFQMCQLCQPPSWHIHWHSWHMCQKCVIFS